MPILRNCISETLKCSSDIRIVNDRDADSGQDFSEAVRWRNRMRESRSYGSVGGRGGNEPLYPENGPNLRLSIYFYTLFPRLKPGAIICFEPMALSLVYKLHPYY